MQIKDIRKKKKSLKIGFKNYCKAYLTGLFFSSLITLIPCLIIFNLAMFYSLITTIYFLCSIVLIMFIFFTLLFKDKALEVYVEGYKEVESEKLLFVMMTFVSVVILLTTFILVRLFRWW